MTDPGDVIGLLSIGGAFMLTVLKVVEKFSRKSNDSRPTAAPPICRADEVGERLQEYHEENRQVLRDIRDGIRELVVLGNRGQTK